MTPLAVEIARTIEQEGPIPLARYMALALGHPRHGYYMTNEPFGRRGDFTTAPEISQMFGEVIGAWVAHTWQDMGSPRRLSIVELGPGRGTLMADVLRVTRLVPPLRAAVRVHLVETSPVLRVRQEETLRRSGVPVVWHDRIDDVPAGPSIVLANEFLDALPARQFEARRGRWYERMVGLDDTGRLRLGLAPDPMPGLSLPRSLGRAPDGTVFEIAPEREAAVASVGARIERDGGAALFIDYGHTESAYGDTFQALRKHVPTDPLAEPGRADVTSHVDFAAIARALRRTGVSVHGPMTQGEFLLSLGIAHRAERLAAGKPVEIADEVAAAVERLTAPRAMGGLFKVIAATARGLRTPPPFA